MTTQIKQAPTERVSVKQVSIKQVSHSAVGGDPAGLGLALAVARELHAPVSRAPEVSTVAARRPRRTPARRRTVVRG
ncbi:hypothetical protein [Streptomyces sp. NPDC050535]|uniref:hypothetical protein n=1 Tax=Streptomyces sp. NPDC050535 TaxID=3365626 RepID=UPI0037A10EB0